MKKKWAQVVLGTALALATGMSVASKLPDTIRLVVGYPAGELRMPLRGYMPSNCVKSWV